MMPIEWRKSTSFTVSSKGNSFDQINHFNKIEEQPFWEQKSLKKNPTNEQDFGQKSRSIIGHDEKLEQLNRK